MISPNHTPSTCVSQGAPLTKRNHPRRQEDHMWSWPKQLCFMDKEDIDIMPNDIKKSIYSYLRTSIDWSS